MSASIPPRVGSFRRVVSQTSLEQQPYIIFRIADASDSQSELRLHIRRGTSVATAIAVATEVAVILEQLTGCGAIEVSVRYPVRIFGPRVATAQPNAPGGGFVFTCDRPGQFCTITIPCIDESLVSDDNTLNEADGRISALLSAMQTSFCNPFGYSVVGLGAAWRVG